MASVFMMLSNKGLHHINFNFLMNIYDRKSELFKLKFYLGGL